MIALALRIKESDEPILRESEKRAYYSTNGKLPNCRHRGKPVETAMGSAADQMGFDLVVAMVRGEQVETAMFAAPAGKEPVACDSRGLLYPGCRLLSRPDEDFVSDGSR